MHDVLVANRRKGSNIGGGGGDDDGGGVVVNTLTRLVIDMYCTVHLHSTWMLVGG